MSSNQKTFGRCTVNGNQVWLVNAEFVDHQGNFWVEMKVVTPSGTYYEAEVASTELVPYYHNPVTVGGVILDGFFGANPMEGFYCIADGFNYSAEEKDELIEEERKKPEDFTEVVEPDYDPVAVTEAVRNILNKAMKHPGLYEPRIRY